ncbi:hypothetical protein F4810DRAFT_599121 [Camillea tinctor]|nr:hypothetical protein F4810DRAFT_599121 [Camillea tinctor]
MSAEWRPSNDSCEGNRYNTAIGRLIPDSNRPVGIATYNLSRSDGTPNSLAWRSMQRCCNPNEVHKLDNDCVLWCELPLNESATHFILERNNFFECLHADNGTAIAAAREATNGDNEDNAAPMTAGRPTVLGVSILAMMVGFFCMMG